MKQYIKIIYKEDTIVYAIDTEQVQFNYSEGIGVADNYSIKHALQLGTTDHTFKFKEFWKELKDRKNSDVSAIIVTDENDNILYDFICVVNSIIYNVNFNGPGDMLTFDIIIKEE